MIIIILIDNGKDEKISFDIINNHKYKYQVHRKLRNIYLIIK